MRPAESARDRRLHAFRAAVDALVESLDAVIRLAKWTDAEPAPEPLVTSASKIVERLGAADRLVGSRFEGPAAEAASVAAMCAAMKRLDVAYRSYRSHAESSSDDARDAAATLESEIVAATAGPWR